MTITMVTIIFQICDATLIIRLLIRVISDLKVNFNYVSNLDEVFYTKQFKDGECNGDNYFFKFLMPHLLSLLIWVISDRKQMQW